MSMFATRRDGPLPDGIKCTVCHKEAAHGAPIFDLRIGFCDGETVDGSIVLAAHRQCVIGVLNDAAARRQP
jgi:hypothetical protein